MVKKGFTPEQIINKLREAEIMLSQGTTLSVILKKIGVRSPPYQRIDRGDIILLKQSSGPIVGLCEVEDAWFYELDKNAWKIIKRDFASALCAQDPEFWDSRKSATYATLIRISHVKPITPKFIQKKIEEAGSCYLRNAFNQL
jgi:hypothetical protein